MLPLDIQGLGDRTRVHQGQLPIDCRSRPAASTSPASPVSNVSPGSTVPRRKPGPGRLVLADKPVNSHLTETTSLPLSLSTAGPVDSLGGPKILSTPAPVPVPAPAPLPSPPLTAPLAAHYSPTSIRKRDSGFHVEPASPRLHSPLRHSVTFSNDISPSSESRFQTFPAGHARPHSFDMAYTGDKKTTAPRSSAARMGEQGRRSLPAVAEGTAPNRFPTWFSRTATSSANPSSSSSSATPEARARSASSASKVTSPAGLSRFNFFGTAPTPTPVSVSVPQNDELMNLDIEKGLFPNGAPIDGTAFSPSAFKNLQMNATGLLSKFQAAYQQRTIEFQELKAEHDTQASSNTDTEDKIERLERQLEEHVQKAAERDALIQHLLNQLAQEKEQSLDQDSSSTKEIAPSRASTVSEDLSVDEDRQRRWRKSTSTSGDEDSMDEASVFSRSRSPTLSTNVSVSEMSPIPTPTAQSKPIILEPPRAIRGSNTQMNAFQKLFKGITSEAPKNGASAGPESCSNCQGQEASIAWDTVNLLKDENKGLKQRVEELETAVESALDVVNGLVL
ncbi:hypothetical protein ACJ41O_011241 [Fusarium nematophilum]